MNSLTIALNNMKKYSNEDHFKVGKVKLEFSVLTCSPIFNPRFASSKDSPLLFSSKRVTRAKTKKYDEEIKSNVNCNRI